MVADEGIADVAVVSLDTEVFVQQNFQYSRGLLAAFSQHVRSGRARHVMPEVTINEVQARIAHAVDEARSALRTYQNKARILRNSQSPSLRRMFRMPNRKRAVHDLWRQFADYIAALDTTVLPINSVTPADVFGRYFSGEPPFGAGKKKFEFPDAFAIETLRLYSEQTKSVIAVVSGDPDWEDALRGMEGLVRFERLEELLQTFQAESPLLELATSTIALVEAEIKQLTAKEALTLSFVVADRSARVLDVSPRNVSLHNMFVVDASEATITFAADAWIGVDLRVEYLDVPAYGKPLPWDLGGYKRYDYFRDPESPDTLQSYESFRLLGSVTWDARGPGAARMSDLTIVEPRTVPVYFGDYYSGS